MGLPKVLFFYLFLLFSNDKPLTKKETAGETPVPPLKKRTTATVNEAHRLAMEEFYENLKAMEAELTETLGSQTAHEFCATLNAKASEPDFLFEIQINKSSKNETKTVRSSIEWSLRQHPLPHTRLDSASRIVNYVYTHYAYGENSLLSPNELSSASMEEIGKRVNDNSLAGMCGDLAQFTGTIISTMFPEWGTPIVLHAHPQDDQGLAHSFAGLVDGKETVYMILDPTVNGIWMDEETGKPLSLDELQFFLRNQYLAARVTKYSSNVFSGHRKILHEGRFLFSTDFHTSHGLSAKAALGRPGSYIVTGDLVSDDDSSDLGFKAFFAPAWKNKGYPMATWANTALEVTHVQCNREEITAGVTHKYHLQFIQLENGMPAYAER